MTKRAKSVELFLEEVVDALVEGRKPQPVGTVCVWPTGTYEKLPDGRWARVGDLTTPAKRRCYPPGTSMETIKADFVAPVAVPPPSPEAPPEETPVEDDDEFESYEGKPFDMKTLSTAFLKLAKLWEGKTFDAPHSDLQTIEARVQTGRIRAQLRSLCAQYGMTSQDSAFGKADADWLGVQKLKKASGIHNSAAGYTVISPDCWERAVGFFKAMDTGTPPSWGEARAFATLVHEEIHGHSPLGPATYEGIGALLEEATVESAARRIAANTLTGKPLKMKGAVQDPANTFDYVRVNGAYEEEVHKVMSMVSGAYLYFGVKLADLQVMDLVEQAAFKMRGGPTKTVNGQKLYVRAFVKHLPMLAPLDDKKREKFEEVMAFLLRDYAKSKGRRGQFAGWGKVKVNKEKMKVEHRLTTLRAMFEAGGDDVEHADIYALKRNDEEGALKLARRMAAAGILTPEAVAVMLKLQDDPTRLIAMLDKLP